MQQEITNKTSADNKAAQASFLIELFRRLNEAGVSYCALRNYENLPENTGNHDLDLLIAPNELEKAFCIVKESAHAHGGRVIAYYRRSGIIVRFCGKRGERWWGVAIDLFPDMEYWGFSYYDTASVFKNSIQWRGIPVAEKDAAISAFIKECLHTGKNRKGYAKEAAKRYVKSPDYFDAILQCHFGSKAAKEFSDFFAQEAQSSSVRALCRAARKALWLTALRKNPFQAILQKLNCHLRRFSRIFAPSGVAVAVLGTDGSGKSTVIDGIWPLLACAMHNEVKYEHLRPNLLPGLAQLFGRSEPEGPVTNPHGSKPSGFFGSLIRLSYYTIDYIFGYWFKVFPLMVKRPTIWIFDRYCYDYLIDPYRSRLSLPKWIIRLYVQIIPQPNTILCLGANPEVIHSRKPELPIEAVQRQVEQLREFCEKNPRAVWINTGCSIEDSVNQALQAITSRMAARYE